MVYDNLLPHLTDEEFKDLYNKYINGDNKAKEKIILHNMRLVMHCVKSVNSSFVHDGDIIDIGVIGLIKALNTYDINRKTNFSTCAQTIIRNEVLMYLRKVSRINQFESSINLPVTYDSEGKELTVMEVLLDEDKNIEDNYIEEDYKKYLNEIIESLPEEEQKIIKLKFGFFDVPYTQKEIAVMLCRSQSYVSQSTSKILEKLKIKMKKYEK